MVLEKTLKSPLDWKEIKPVHPKWNQPWIFIGRTDVEAEDPIFGTWCEELTHWKKSWCWETLKVGGEGTTEDEMVGRHHWLEGHVFEQALGVGDGQGSLACCSSWGRKELDMIEQLNWRDFLVPLCAIRVVSSAYLSWLVFLWAILIPACASSSWAFHMMYSA